MKHENSFRGVPGTNLDWSTHLNDRDVAWIPSVLRCYTAQHSTDCTI